MQMNALRLFCDVAHTASFTAAARLHSCTPAGASQSFHALEKKFGQSTDLAFSRQAVIIRSDPALRATVVPLKQRFR